MEEELGADMINTGVRAKETEIEELKDLLSRARNTPVITLSMAQAIAGGLSGDAQTIMLERCHEIALSHGLPEIEGFYGCDLATGEFLREGA